MDVPCKDCERKGCGSYHDICPMYQEFKKEKNEDYKERLKKSQKRQDLNYIDHIHFMRLRKKNHK